MTSKITELNEENFDSFVRDGRVVVDFWASWCGPCKMMGPIFDAASDELKDKAKFAKVNVDESTELAQRFGVMSIPTLMFFHDGQPVDRAIGLIPKEMLVRKVKEMK